MRFSATRTDVHQHLWSESLVAALASRPSPPRAGRVRGGFELVLSAEPRSPLTLDDPARRAALLARDGVDQALIALSAALGVEELPVDQADTILSAYAQDVRELPSAFRAWGGGAAGGPARPVPARLGAGRSRAAERLPRMGRHPTRRSRPPPHRRASRRGLRGAVRPGRRRLEPPGARPPRPRARAAGAPWRPALRAPGPGAHPRGRCAGVVAIGGRLRAVAASGMACLGGLRAPAAPLRARAVRRARRSRSASGRAADGARRPAGRMRRPLLLRHLVLRSQRNRGDGARRRPRAARVRL